MDWKKIDWRLITGCLYVAASLLFIFVFEYGSASVSLSSLNEMCRNLTGDNEARFDDRPWMQEDIICKRSMRGGNLTAAYTYLLTIGGD